MAKKNSNKKNAGVSLERGESSQWAAVVLALIAGLIPLIVFLHVVQVPAEMRHYWIQPENYDFFSWWKARLIILSAILLLPAIGVSIMRKQVSLRNMVLYFLGAFMLIVVLSALVSKYPHIAWTGYYDRYEGTLVWLAYGVLALFAYAFFKEIKQFELFAKLFLVFAVVLCLLGLGQFFGADILKTMAGRYAILPAQYDQIAPYLNFTFGQYTIYVSLYNTNYVGSYMALLFPASFVLFLYADKKKAFVFGALSVLFCMVQLGCNSRAGYVGVLAAFFVIAIAMHKKLFASWKRVALIGCMYLVIFAGMNAYTGGVFVDRASEFKISKLAGVETAPKTPIDKLIVNYGGFASGRGYIWLRSLEMMKHTVLIGHGADTFTMYFPKDDPFKGYGGLEKGVMVDKPHNMYLQLGNNFGIPALIVFVLMMGMHAVTGLKRIGFLAATADKKRIYAFAAMISVIAYLVSNIFNDSIVSVAPVFWVIFGLSLAFSRMLKEGTSSEQK